MGLKEIQDLKAKAGEPKPKKVYYIPKVSKKKLAQKELQKVVAELDEAFYLEVWNASPHKCIECDVYLGKHCQNIFMHHMLPKAKYPQFRHTPENIAIVCLQHHSQAEMDLDKVPKIKKRTEEIIKLLLN